MRQQQLACLRGHGTPAVAGQQVLVQLNFKQAYLSAQSRLRNVQSQSRAREAAHFGHAHKIFELFKVHAAVFVIAINSLCLNAIAASLAKALTRPAIAAKISP
jgi:hypothetical protein